MINGRYVIAKLGETRETIRWEREAIRKIIVNRIPSMAEKLKNKLYHCDKKNKTQARTFTY